MSVVDHYNLLPNLINGTQNFQLSLENSFAYEFFFKV